MYDPTAVGIATQDHDRKLAVKPVVVLDGDHDHQVSTWAGPPAADDPAWYRLHVVHDSARARRLACDPPIQRTDATRQRDQAEHRQRPRLHEFALLKGPRFPLPLCGCQPDDGVYACNACCDLAVIVDTALTRWAASTFTASTSASSSRMRALNKFCSAWLAHRLPPPPIDRATLTIRTDLQRTRRLTWASLLRRTWASRRCSVRAATPAWSSSPRSRTRPSHAGSCCTCTRPLVRLPEARPGVRSPHWRSRPHPGPARTSTRRPSSTQAHRNHHPLQAVLRRPRHRLEPHVRDCRRPRATPRGC